MSFCPYCQMAANSSNGNVYCSIKHPDPDSIPTGVFQIGNGEIHSGQHRSRFALRFIYSANARLMLDGRVLHIHKPALVQFNEHSSYELDIPAKGASSAQLGIAINHHDLSRITAAIRVNADKLLDDPFIVKPPPSFIPYERIISAQWQGIATKAKQLLSISPDRIAGAITILSMDAVQLLLKEEPSPGNSLITSIKKVSTRQELMYRLSKGKDFLENSFEGDGRVEQAAAVACMSLYHFIRTFREAWGETPYQFVLRKKLMKAHRLISEGACSLQDIATVTGYTDYSAFSRKFRQHFGISPSTLREG